MFVWVRDTPHKQLYSQPLFGILGLLSLGALALATVLPNVAVRLWERRFADGSWPGQLDKSLSTLLLRLTDEEKKVFWWWHLYQLILMFRGSLVTIAAFFQSVVYFNEGNLFSLGVAFALLVVLLFQWPNRERIDRWVEARWQAVDRLRRGKVNSLGQPKPISPTVIERFGRWVASVGRKRWRGAPEPLHLLKIPRRLMVEADSPVEAGRLAEMEARTRALERQLANVRFLLGGILGAGAGGLAGDRLGAVVGLLVGCGVALFGRLLPALLAGGVAGGCVASTHFGGEVATVAGAVGGALLAACVAEIGRPSRPDKADSVPSREDPGAPK
jgi:hypothetical protein